MTGLTKLFGGAPKAAPLPPPPTLPPIPTRNDTEVADAADDEARRRRIAAGRASTNLTGDQGVTGQATIGRTLLGGYRQPTGV